MDALALLCNLYGDGPATLKRLRSAGCDSFGALEDLEPDQLAPILGTNEAAARRFLREARLLVERLADEELEQEERPPLPAALATPARPSESVRAALGGLSTGAGSTQGRSAAGRGNDDVDARSSEVIDRVLATWRERDLVRAAAGERMDGGALEDHLGEEGPEVNDEPAGRAEEPAEPEGAEAVRTPLVPRLLDGLDRLQCEALERAGFATLEELADADALVVGRQAELELTRVMRLQFLARRLLGERGTTAAGEPAFSLSGPSVPSGPSGARPWPLARGIEPTAPLPAREPRRGSAGPSPLDRVPLPAPREPEAMPGEAELAGSKFSMSEAPFGGATSRLADELDRAARLLRHEDAHEAGPAEGTGGPFA